jgi:hypothetical protein
MREKVSCAVNLESLGFTNRNNTDSQSKLLCRVGVANISKLPSGSLTVRSTHGSGYKTRFTGEDATGRVALKIVLLYG